jgi:hypothetical protein
MRKLFTALALSCVALGVIGAQAASAYTYSGVNDVDGLFGTASISGGVMEFNAPLFNASASAGGSTVQNGLLQFTVTANGSETIDQIWITELGSYAFGGTSAVEGGTFLLLGMSGTITIDARTSGPTGQVINFGTVGFDPFFPVSNPAGLAGSYLPMTGAVSSPWDSTLFLYLGTIIPNATQVTIAFNNTLTVYSEATSSAQIEKDSIKINVVPEPGTFALFCGGLLALSIRARSRRA